MTRTSSIALLVYNYPSHIRQTVEAMQAYDFPNADRFFVLYQAIQTANQESAAEKWIEYIPGISGFNTTPFIRHEENFHHQELVAPGFSVTAHKPGVQA